MNTASGDRAGFPSGGGGGARTGYYKNKKYSETVCGFGKAALYQLS